MAYHVLHPFTALTDSREIDKKLMIAHSSKGSWVKDQKGDHYYNISNAALILGSAHKDLITEISKQYEKLSIGLLMGQGHVEARNLADKLIEIFPQFQMVFYSNDGTGTIESAMKMARQYFYLKGKTKKKKFISLSGGYHGTTYGSMSITHIGIQELYGPVMGACLEAPYPDTYRNEQAEDAIDEAAVALEQMIVQEDPDTIAAIVLEPIQSVSGIRVIPEEYLKKVRLLTKKYGILLIVDEVTTGMGRVGAWSASGDVGVEADILTLSKGLTAGFFPLGATLLRKEIADVFIKGGGFPHGATLAGHPVGCAIGLAVINNIISKDLIGNVNKYGMLIKEELLQQLHDFPYLGEVRGKGLMIGVEFTENQITKQAAPLEFQNRFVKNLLENGLLTLFSNGILSLYPPYNLSDIDADFIVDTVVKSAKGAYKNLYCRSDA